MTLVSDIGLERSRLARLPCAALLLLACVLASPEAHAEDAETRTAARDLATQGAQAFDSGRYADASDFFRRAHELVHAPTIALMQARSLTKLGLLLEAIDVYEQTARFKLGPDSPEAYAGAVQSAQTELEDVRKRVPRLKLTLLGATSDELPQVTMDDRPTPAALLGVERPINPGPHRIAVRLGGQLRASRSLSLLEGESYRVDLDVQPARPAPVPSAPTPEAAQPTERKSTATNYRLWGYVGLGVGALGLGVGTYTGLRALQHKSELDLVCHPDCPPTSAEDLHGFRTNRTVSWISYGVGLAAVAGGVALLTLGPPEREHVAIHALPNGFLLGGRL